MVIRLTPDQCSSYWEDLSAGIKASMPPFSVVTEEGLNEILRKLLAEDMHAWVMIEDGNVLASAITSFQVDVGTGDNQLLIYSLFGYRFIKETSWKEGVKVLGDFAAMHKCKKVIAYTCVPRIIEVAKSLGASANYVFLHWEV